MAVNLLGLTTVNRVKLYQGQPTTSEATLYTVAALTNVKLQSIIVCNTTATAATLSLSVVTAAGTAGVTNRILAAFSVAANDTVTIDVPVEMGAADFLSGLQGTASALTLTISGETYA